jgi:hypothetical protein
MTQVSDVDVMQDFFDAFTVVNKLNAIVRVDEFLAGRHGLLDYGPKPDSDPRHVLSCIQRIYKGIGPRLFKSFVTLENVAPAEGLDDVWAHWCPLPAGVELHKQDYPAGAIPLWSNGTKTVICRMRTDSHGNEEFDFAVC